MKLVITILRDIESEPVSQALITGGFRVTRIASTGGFLRRGSSTLMVGVSDEAVDQVVEVIRRSVTQPAEPGQHRATLFVLPVEHYSQI